jgi:iron complex transport system substrate-binding protein
MMRSRPLTRRGLFIHGGVGVALGSLLLADRRTVGATPVAGTPRGEAFPVTLTHAMGETTIPARPERVVSASDFIDLDLLLSLGVEPVLYGFSNAWDSGEMPWQSAALGLPTFDAAGDLDLEAIVAARPDLIVTIPVYRTNGYELLSEMAPKIVLDWSTEWREGTRLVGRAVGLEERAEERIAETETLIAAASETLAPIAGKPVMVGFQYQDAFLYLG